MEVSMCKEFPGMTPISLRKEKAREVFIMISRYNQYSGRKKKQKKTGKKIIRRPASDNWF